MSNADTGTPQGSPQAAAAGQRRGRDRQHPRPRDARPRRRLRRAPPAGRRADRGLRALRVLPADLPDVRAVGRGDGLPARTDLPDEGGSRGRADVRRDGVALGRLPRLHGLRDRLPLGRAVRHAHRADPGAGRAPPRPQRQGPGAARPDLRALPAPAGGCGCCAGRCARSRGPGSTGGCAGPGCSSGWRRSSRPWRASPRGWAGPSRCPSGSRRPGRGGPPSACSPGACRARSSPA